MLGPDAGAGSAMLRKLKQAEQLLNSQSDLIDELKQELAQAQASHSDVHETIVGMPESQLAAVQQQHTADMLQAVAEYVRQGLKPGIGHASDDSLAAMQRNHTVKLINEVTHYLRRDMQNLQQMCDMIAASPLPYSSARDHRTSSPLISPNDAELLLYPQALKGRASLCTMLCTPGQSVCQPT